MVKHVILWQLKEELQGEEKIKVMKEMKEHLEGLVGVVPGLIELEIIIDKLDSSNADVMLNSTLESEDALKGYAVNPNHVAVADTYVRPFTANRVCIDYEI